MSEYGTYPPVDADLELTESDIEFEQCNFGECEREGEFIFRDGFWYCSTNCLNKETGWTWIDNG